MTTAVRTAAMAPHQRRQQPPVWVIDRHPLGYGHEDHLGTTHWKRPWSAFIAAVALGLVGVIERVRETPAQPREVHPDSHTHAGTALRLGLTTLFLAALARWRISRRRSP